MLVQTLDDKKHCVGIYNDGKLIYDCEEFDFDAVTATWSYNPVFLQNDALIALNQHYDATIRYLESKKPIEQDYGFQDVGIFTFFMIMGARWLGALL